MKHGAGIVTRSTALALAAMAAGSLLLAACGQKGPLYLPDARKQPVPQASVPAPATDGSDSDKKKADQAPAR